MMFSLHLLLFICIGISLSMIQVETSASGKLPIYGCFENESVYKLGIQCAYEGSLLHGKECWSDYKIENYFGGMKDLKTKLEETFENLTIKSCNASKFLECRNPPLNTSLEYNEDDPKNLPQCFCGNYQVPNEIQKNSIWNETLGHCVMKVKAKCNKFDELKIRYYGQGDLKFVKYRPIPDSIPCVEHAYCKSEDDTINNNITRYRCKCEKGFYTTKDNYCREIPEYHFRPHSVTSYGIVFLIFGTIFCDIVVLREKLWEDECTPRDYDDTNGISHELILEECWAPPPAKIEWPMPWDDD